MLDRDVVEIALRSVLAKQADGAPVAELAEAFVGLYGMERVARLVAGDGPMTGPDVSNPGFALARARHAFARFADLVQDGYTEGKYSAMAWTTLPGFGLR